MIATAGIRKSPSPFLRSATLLIGCVFCVGSLAANNSFVECDELSRDKQDLDSAVPALNVSMADHYLVPPADSVNQSADTDAVDPETIAPILSLGPRVSGLLERVFSTDDATSGQVDREATESASPVAEYTNDQSDAETGAVEELELPQIQQRMYRKDI